MKTIFAIGANSAFAKQVIPILAQSNRVITAGRKDCDVYCDVSKHITIPENVDTVINFSAAFGGENDEKIATAQAVNTTGPLHICMAAKQAKVEQIIMISSLSAVLEAYSPYYSIYAVTKRHGDELAELYCTNNKMGLTIIRPSQIYGDDDSFKHHQPFFYTVVDKAQKGEDIKIYGSNDARRNYIHSLDIAEVISRIISQSITGTYSCEYPADVTYSELADTAQKTFGKGGNIIFLKEKPDIPDNVFSKDTSLYEKIDYSPRIDLATGMQRIKKYREGS